jgi:hypothetical protein
MTTGLEAPVLFRDFNVGDFVRVKIVHGGFSFFGWARVATATLNVDSSGVENTSAIALELLTGGSPLGDPELAFYDQLDEIRRRLEAIDERSNRSRPRRRRPCPRRRPGLHAAARPDAAAAAASPRPGGPADDHLVRRRRAVGRGRHALRRFTVDADGGGNDAHVVVSLSPGGARTPSVDLGATRGDRPPADRRAHVEHDLHGDRDRHERVRVRDRDRELHDARR